jgi:hypothetical protein
MAYEIDKYDEEGIVWEVVNDGTPEFYGSYEECQEYIDTL